MSTIASRKRARFFGRLGLAIPMLALLTLGGLPSPYGGTMTITYGGRPPSREAKARAEYDANLRLTLTILGCGAGCLLAAALLGIAQVLTSPHRADQS